MKRLLPIIVILVLFPLQTSALAPVSRDRSRVTLNPNGVPADNATNIGIVVDVRDGESNGLANRVVTARSSRGTSLDTIFPLQATTDNFGIATFSIKSGVPGSPTLSVVADGASLQAPSPVFTGSGVSGTTGVSETKISGATSVVSVFPATVAADGVSYATVTVMSRNAYGQNLVGKWVTLSSSRGNQDAIVSRTNPSAEVAAGSAVATFEIRSTTDGTSTITASSEGVTVQQRASIKFSKTLAGSAPPPAPPVAGVGPGNIIKASNLPAVYYIGSDNRRHLFPNERVYASWFPTFFGLKTVSPATLSSIAQGANVRVKPGNNLVQFVATRADGRGFAVTDSRVYALERGGTLRWIRSPGVAVALYGTMWERQIVPVPETEFSQYRVGVDILLADSFNRALVLGSVPSISADLGL